MTNQFLQAESAWAPDACTLPTFGRPLRIAEWDDLFATAITDVRREGPLQARFELQPLPGVAARAADLAHRESQCCSFFVFSLAMTGDRLTLAMAAPAEQVAVIDGLVERARAATARPS